MTQLAVIEKLYPDAPTPKRATAWSAGFDLQAYFSGKEVVIYDEFNEKTGVVVPHGGMLILRPGNVALIPTGYKIKLPIDCEAQIRPRSGLALKQKLVPVNSPGTIDADFPGEWAVLLENRSQVDIPVFHGDRLAQAVVTKYQTLRFEDGQVGVSTERTSGFGSTGK